MTIALAFPPYAWPTSSCQITFAPSDIPSAHGLITVDVTLTESHVWTSTHAVLVPDPALSSTPPTALDWLGHLVLSIAHGAAANEVLDAHWDRLGFHIQGVTVRPDMDMQTMEEHARRQRQQAMEAQALMDVLPPADARVARRPQRL